MSTMKHATISAWKREEDGSYQAEINEWTLRVTWQPEAPNRRRGFTWTAERGNDKVGPSEIFEEIELAMVAAEASAVPAEEHAAAH